MSIQSWFPFSRAGLLAAMAVVLFSAAIVSCTPSTPGLSNPSAEAARGAADAVKLDNADATYVGEKECLSCHEHAGTHASMNVHLKAFRSNPRGVEQAQVCEACHGPGSKHAKESTNRAYIIGYTRNWGTPVAQQNAQCLTCHQGGQRVFWVNSTHDANKVACSDCHNPMVKNSLTGSLVRSGISETCYQCHQQQRAEFLKRSHMPLPEGKISCEDCHNPHGSPTAPLLKADTVNELCYKCHAEKRGPFIWDHAPVRENCANCHLPHGSNHDKLLVAPRPMLCQQCHSVPGHPSMFYNNGMTAASNIGGADVALGAVASGGIYANPRMINRACQNCHSQIHGSNHPSGALLQR